MLLPYFTPLRCVVFIVFQKYSSFFVLQVTRSPSKFPSRTHPAIFVQRIFWVSGELYSPPVPDGPPCVFPPPLHLLIIDLLFNSAADFNCRLPANTPPAKIFILTFLGLFLPIVFIVVLGAVLMTVPAYVEAYTQGDAAAVLSKGTVCHHSVYIIYSDAYFIWSIRAVGPWWKFYPRPTGAFCNRKQQYVMCSLIWSVLLTHVACLRSPQYMCVYILKADFIAINYAPCYFRFSWIVNADTYSTVSPYSSCNLHCARLHHLHGGRCSRSSALQHHLEQFSCRCKWSLVTTHFGIDLHITKLGYWISFWVVILLEEHYIFRRKNGMLGGYDLYAYDSPAL